SLLITHYSFSAIFTFTLFITLTNTNMSFLKNFITKKKEPANTYTEFWGWLAKNEKKFYNVIKSRGDFEKVFFTPLSDQLARIKDGFFYLAGIYNETTVELIITADGFIKNIVFAEEIIDAAPVINGWRFTALKPAIDIQNMGIQMGDNVFNKDNLFFYANEIQDYPDEIDITMVHADYTEANKDVITNGTFIFLDNYLGELNFASTIDNLVVTGKDKAIADQVPVEKLMDFLKWRQKEFLEKYEDVRHNTENDNYSVLKADLPNGDKLIATINTDILTWENKASHPWIANVEIKFQPTDNDGMPDQPTYLLLNEIEDDINAELKDEDGYLNIGRQTVNGTREIYFACREFRKPSKVLFAAGKKYEQKLNFTYDIYKDKYWRSFDRFKNNS
ncbi:MAG: DUF695 domain-containing protein, partial [Chitinophagales bacterium]